MDNNRAQHQTARQPDESTRGTHEEVQGQPDKSIGGTHEEVQGIS
jgi:hypothetical protein